MSTDWQTAAERMNRFANVDLGLRHKLCELSKAEARDDKIAVKLEEGRSYGVRQQYYDTILKRQLARALWRKDLVEDHW
jgi:hypothetical protein